MRRPNPSEQILELRFKPNARVLDRRGEWAETLAAKLRLPRWQIIENRLDLFTEDMTERAFVSFRNFGFLTQDARSQDSHRDRAKEVVQAVFSLPGFARQVEVERLGVRGRFCVPYEGSFADLRKLYTTHYASPQPDLVAAFGSDVSLEDIGAPLNFVDAVGHFNTACGPMAHDQLGEFFKKRDQIPEVGLYYEVDYWDRGFGAMGAADVARRLTEYSKAVWTRYGQVASLILQQPVEAGTPSVASDG